MNLYKMNKKNLINLIYGYEQYVLGEANKILKQQYVPDSVAEFYAKTASTKADQKPKPRRLSDEDVRAIRNSTDSYKILANQYGYSKSGIASIKTFKIYKNVV
jgi:hypothetical protein